MINLLCSFNQISLSYMIDDNLLNVHSGLARPIYSQVGLCSLANED
jgi:hypothetical protein